MESEMDNHNGLFCVLWKVSVPHVPQQVGFQIVVIFEPHSGDGLTIQNGGVCLLVNFILRFCRKTLTQNFPPILKIPSTSPFTGSK